MATAHCGRSNLPEAKGFGLGSAGSNAAGGASASGNDVAASQSSSGPGLVVDASSASSVSSTSSGAGGAACGFDAGSDSGAVSRGMACLNLEGPCPSPEDAMRMLRSGLCTQVVAVCSGPFPATSRCCYEVATIEIPCYVGRTFFIDEGSLKAELRVGTTWLGESAAETEATATAEMGPRVSPLNQATRRALAEAWARDGLFEHASIASFSRFAMQLLAVGAPADLVRDTHAGALDEVRHAELCLALASAYAGEPLELGLLPLPTQLPLPIDLRSIAMEAAMEGCIGETVAAIQAHEALLETTDPMVRHVLAVTVEDETRHAELAWRFLAWAIDTGGASVRDAIVGAFSSFRPPPPRPDDLMGVDLDAFGAHGRLTAEKSRAIAECVLREVISPGVCALLARTPKQPRAMAAAHANLAERAATTG